MDKTALFGGGTIVVTGAGSGIGLATAERLFAHGVRVVAVENVAGIMDGFEPTDEITDATWDRVPAVNLTAMMRVTRAVAPGPVTTSIEASDASGAIILVDGGWAAA